MQLHILYYIDKFLVHSNSTIYLFIYLQLFLDICGFQWVRKLLILFIYSNFNE